MVVQFIVFLTLSTLICRGTDISKCFSESLGIRDNESRLYMSLIYVEWKSHGLEEYVSHSHVNVMLSFLQILNLCILGRKALSLSFIKLGYFTFILTGLSCSHYLNAFEPVMHSLLYLP